MKLSILISFLSAVPTALSAGYRLVGSSGCTAQMVFVPPNTDTVVFIDNYHANYGGPGYDYTTGTQSTTSYVYPGTAISVFGTEYNLSTNTIRPLKPISDTFCSAGAFFPNGTLVNVAGAEAGVTGVAEGFDQIRTYNAGSCTGGVCTGDWIEATRGLQVYRWYPTAQTMVNGDILVVGGSNVGGLVLNEASINVPTYEIVHVNGSIPAAPVTLPILEFTAAENLVPNKSYNLYPIMHLLPNAGVSNQLFTLAGNSTIIWDYGANALVKNLPDTPLQPRTFPSSATSVLLPLEFPDYTPKILLCGGSSADIPNPLALDDCYTINPSDDTPVWTAVDNMPNGPQTMSDGILLPDGTVLLINGARLGSGGGYQADIPVLIPMIYNDSAPTGSKFTNQPATTIPRLYHSVAILLASGEVLIAGSNPSVYYSYYGGVPSGWPFFYQNGHLCALEQQQYSTSFYPTEYRVEIFSPPYLDAAASAKPVITSAATTIGYNTTFRVQARLGSGRTLKSGTKFSLVHPGFHTHGQSMGQRMISLGFTAVGNSFSFEVTGPRDASVMPPGHYMLFAVSNGIPSTAVWVELA